VTGARSERAGGGGAGDFFSLAGLTGVGLGVGASAAGCSGCVVVRSGADALVSGSAGAGGGAAVVTGGGVSAGSTRGAVLATLRATSVGDELRPTM
jgi:hypothetical protein